MITIPCKFTPRPHQLEFLAAMNSGKYRALLRWHRRAGKDKVCWNYLIYRAAMKAGNYYYFFPTSQQARLALWETRDNEGLTAVDHIPEELGATISSHEMRVILPTKDGQTSVIRAIGLDTNTDYKRGISCQGAIFSEFSYQTSDAYKVVMPSIRGSNGFAVFNSTPQGHDHFYDLEQAALESIEKHGLKSKWYVSHLQTLYPDQPNYSGLFTKEQILEIQSEEKQSDEYMTKEYGAMYETGVTGTIYGDFISKAREEGRIGAYPYDNNYPVHVLADLGYNDPTALIFLQYIEGSTRIIDSWEDNRKDIHTIVKEVLFEKGYSYAAIHLPHDADQNYGLGVTKREMFEKALQAYKLNNYVTVGQRQPIKIGIDAVQARFSTYHFNAPRCLDLLEKLAMYHYKWDSKRRTFQETPVHDYTSHYSDAMRLEPLSSSSWSTPVSRRQETYFQEKDVFDV